MTAKTYLWISRWEEFQHYQPERDRAPAWVKMYTKQLDDDRYLALSVKARSVLQDLRIAFARAHQQLPNDTRTLSYRIGQRVTNHHIETLNHAGFLEILSREVLEHRLEEFYASRAPARSQRSKKEERDREPRAVTSTETPRERPPNGTAPDHETVRETVAHSLAATDDDIPF